MTQIFSSFSDFPSDSFNFAPCQNKTKQQLAEQPITIKNFSSVVLICRFDRTWRIITFPYFLIRQDSHINLDLDRNFITLWLKSSQTTSTEPTQCFFAPFRQNSFTWRLLWCGQPKNDGARPIFSCKYRLPNTSVLWCDKQARASILDSILPLRSTGCFCRDSQNLSGSRRWQRSSSFCCDGNMETCQRMSNAHKELWVCVFLFRRRALAKPAICFVYVTKGLHEESHVNEPECTICFPSPPNPPNWSVFQDEQFWHIWRSVSAEHTSPALFK